MKIIALKGKVNILQLRVMLSLTKKGHFSSSEFLGGNSPFIILKIIFAKENQIKGTAFTKTLLIFLKLIKVYLIEMCTYEISRFSD